MEILGIVFIPTLFLTITFLKTDRLNLYTLLFE